MEEWGITGLMYAGGKQKWSSNSIPIEAFINHSGQTLGKWGYHMILFLMPVVGGTHCPCGERFESIDSHILSSNFTSPHQSTSLCYVDKYRIIHCLHEMMEGGFWL